MGAATEGHKGIARTGAGKASIELQRSGVWAAEILGRQGAVGAGGGCPLGAAVRDRWEPSCAEVTGQRGRGRL